MKGLKAGIINTVFLTLVVGGYLLARTYNSQLNIAGPAYAPKFQLQRIENVEPHVLTQQVFGNEVLNGRVTVVNFAANWCEVCKSEKEELARWVKDLTQQGAQFMGILSSQSASTIDITELFPVGGDYLFGFDPNGKVAQQFGVISLPQTLILSKKGQILKKFAGALKMGDKSSAEATVRLALSTENDK